MNYPGSIIQELGMITVSDLPSTNDLLIAENYRGEHAAFNVVETNAYTYLAENYSMLGQIFEVSKLTRSTIGYHNFLVVKSISIKNAFSLGIDRKEVEPGWRVRHRRRKSPVFFGEGLGMQFGKTAAMMHALQGMEAFKREATRIAPVFMRQDREGNVSIDAENHSSDENSGNHLQDLQKYAIQAYAREMVNTDYALLERQQFRDGSEVNYYEPTPSNTQDYTNMAQSECRMWRVGRPEDLENAEDNGDISSF